MLKLANFTNNLFDNVSLEVQEKSVIGIFGENGSGKTTLVKYIAGYYDDYEGEIIIDGKSSNSLNYEVGILLQNPYQQFVGVSIFDDLTYLLEQSLFSRQQIKKILDNYYTDFNKELMLLSGGEAQEVLINNFLKTNKKILILDETFSNLDVGKKEYLFKKLKRSNKIIIFITNNLQDLKYCDEVYELKEKKLNKKLDLNFYNEFSYINNVAEDVIKIENLEVKTLNKKINLKFKKGLNLLLGASGSGKSTIFDALCGFVKYEGKIISQCNSIFLLNQYPFEQITATRVYEIFEQGDYKTYIKKFELKENILNDDIVDLSTGELTQILIIKALLSNSDLILLDESLEVLDYSKQQIILNIFKEIKDKTIICITHNKTIYNDLVLNIMEIV